MDQRIYSGKSVILSSLPKAVEVYEVGPRDGLQNEMRVLSTDEKVELIQALVDSGLKRIEVSSFVSPRWIPQLADAEKLFSRVTRKTGVIYSALVPNLKGLERAKDIGLQEAAVFLSVTESHSQKNINKSVKEAISTVREVAVEAHKLGMRVRCYVSTVWGCPYEGLTPLKSVVDLLAALKDVPFYQLSLGDTIGIGTPLQTQRILEAVSAQIELSRIAVHFHDTRGTALANALVALEFGVTTFDSSIGGLGGCPYAPGAAGNLATEDLVFMLQGMGVDTSVSLEKLVNAGALAQSLIGRKLPGKYLQAALGERDKAAKTTEFRD
jgi:hydroxymethylglutaryl-CoA lyase